MIKPELLMPAGNIEKLKYAIRYGADAVYLGVVDFSLRAMRKGELITLENLKFAVDTAHELGAKAYLTLNIFGFNSDIKALEACMDRMVDSNPDALIISDPGIMRLAKKYMPNGGCGVVSFELKGGRKAAEAFMKHLKLAAIETHVADARTCCLNPATSTHRQMTEEQLLEAGVPAGLVRISCGLEDKEDLIADLAQALQAI